MLAKIPKTPIDKTIQNPQSTRIPNLFPPESIIQHQKKKKLNGLEMEDLTHLDRRWRWRWTVEWMHCLDAPGDGEHHRRQPAGMAISLGDWRRPFATDGDLLRRTATPTATSRDGDLSRRLTATFCDGRRLQPLSLSLSPSLSSFFTLTFTDGWVPP